MNLATPKYDEEKAGSPEIRHRRGYILFYSRGNYNYKNYNCKKQNEISERKCQNEFIIMKNKNKNNLNNYNYNLRYHNIIMTPAAPDFRRFGFFLVIFWRSQIQLCVPIWCFFVVLRVDFCVLICSF